MVDNGESSLFLSVVSIVFAAPKVASLLGPFVATCCGICLRSRLGWSSLVALNWSSMGILYASSSPLMHLGLKAWKGRCATFEHSAGGPPADAS